MMKSSNFGIIPFSDYVVMDEATKTRLTLARCHEARLVRRRAHNKQTLRMLRRLILD